MKDNWRYRSVLPSMGWPAFPGPAATQKLAMLFQLEQGQWRSPAEIATAQLEQAGRVADFAGRTVPYYRERFGFGRAHLHWDEKSWRELPILSRKELQDAGAEICSREIPPQHGRNVEIMTSGSTGQVVKVMATDLTRFFWQVFCLRDHLWHRRDFSQRLATIRYRQGARTTGGTGRRASGWGPASDDVVVTGPSIQFDVLEDIDFLARAMATERPGYLLTHPSVMLGLARHCLDHGLTIPGLREVRTLGESSPLTLRAACRKAWGVPVVDMYSCQEAGYLALQCPDHDHLHVQSENVLLEIVDDSGSPRRPGEIGRVLITTLNNFATPLIRYEIGDYAEVGEPCDCGRGLAVLKRVMGRYRNLLTLPDGTKRFPLMGYEINLADIAPIELMQMVQTSREEITVRLVMARALAAGEQAALTSFIHRNLGHPFGLTFEYVDTIRNPANGKQEQFISLIEQSG